MQMSMDLRTENLLSVLSYIKYLNLYYTSVSVVQAPFGCLQ